MSAATVFTSEHGVGYLCAFGNSFAHSVGRWPPNSMYVTCYVSYILAHTYLTILQFSHNTCHSSSLPHPRLKLRWVLINLCMVLFLMWEDYPLPPSAHYPSHTLSSTTGAYQFSFHHQQGYELDLVLLVLLRDSDFASSHWSTCLTSVTWKLLAQNLLHPGSLGFPSFP